MTDRFSWQSDEEGTWIQPNAPHQKRRRWSFVLIALLVIGLSFGLYRFSLYQLDRREEGIKAEIRAAHSTWLQAVRANDLELLTMLSSRSDSNWYSAQQRLLSSGRMLDRSAFKMSIAVQPVAEPEIILSADFEQAVMRFHTAYDSADENGAPPIVLEQTALYERKGPTWVQRPLTEEEWGETRLTVSPRTVFTYAQRDEAIVRRMASDLDRDLGTICQASKQKSLATSPFCDADGRIRITFVREPTALLTVNDSTRPVLNGLEFRMPSPTLVGQPVDSAAYDALYHGYFDRILQALQQVDAQPVPFPTQHVASLCYSATERGLDLYDYSPTDGRWTSRSTSRAFSYLKPMPDDNGLILRAGFPGVDIDRLQLTLNRNGHELQFLDVGEADLTASFAAFAETGEGHDIVLRFGHGSTGIANYAVVPMSACADEELCAISGIEGFPVWSPDGASTIISDVGQLWLGDGQVQRRYSLGAGFSPFWLSSSVFGYVALATSEENSEMQVIIQDLQTGRQTVIANSAQLVSQAGLGQGGRFRIRYVTASPANPSLVLIGGSPAGGEAEEYYILGIQLKGELDTNAELEVTIPEVLLELSGAPEGDPATFTPTGSPGFTFSEDGRWLVTVRLVDRDFSTWELNLVDLQTRQTKVISTNYPPYPALYPHFDWAADGEWLALVDGGFLRLIAPAHDYELFVPHEYRTCTYTGWINP